MSINNAFVARKGLITPEDILVSGSSTLSGSITFYDNITTPLFASGFAGYGANLDQDTNEKWSLDIDNLTVRGRMRVYELLINQLRATNGSVWVSSTGKVDSVGSGSAFTSSVDLNQSLVAHYTFDDSSALGSGSVFGNPYATVNGNTTVTETSSVGRYALSLDGTGDYLYTGDDSRQYFIDQIGSDSFAFSMWFKTSDATGNNALFTLTYGLQAYLNSSGGIIWGYTIEGGTTIAGGGTSETYNDGNWHHVVVDYDNTLKSGSIYVDGDLKRQFARAHRHWYYGLGLAIGRDLNNGAVNDFDGDLDDFRIYNRVLTQTEITSLYNLGATTKYPSNGLIAYYTFNDGDTSIAYDYSGNGNTGSFSGATIGDSVIGKCADFDGTNDYITLNGISDTISSDQDVSVSFWFNSDILPSAYEAQVSVNTSAGNNVWLIGLNSNGRLYLDANGAFALSSTDQFDAGTWYNMTVTYDSSTSTSTVYLNGVSNFTVVDAVTFSSTDQWSLGMEYDGGTPSDHYDGKIEDLRIYDRVLTQDEITALYNNRGGIKLTTTDDSNHGFLEGDLIRAQRFTGNGVYQSDGVVSWVGNLQTWYHEPINLANPSIELPQQGYEYVRIGNVYDTTRQGAVYMTADDSGAPFIDIIDGIDAHSTFNTQGTIKARLGKLLGITDTAVGLNSTNVYGLYSDSAYLKGNLVVGGGNEAITLSANTVAIGNVTGTANSAIKIADTGTASTSGIFGYNGSSNEVFALKLDNTAKIAGFNFDVNRIYNTNVEINSTDEHIWLKSGADMSSEGIFFSGSGEFNIQDSAGSYLRLSGGTLSANVDNFILSGSNVEVNTPSFFLGSGNNYISGSGGNMEIFTNELNLFAQSATNYRLLIGTDVLNDANYENTRSVAMGILDDAGDRIGIRLGGNDPSYEALFEIIPDTIDEARFIIANDAGTDNGERIIIGNLGATGISGYQNEFGMYLRSGSVEVMRMGTAGNIIAGWAFNDRAIYNISGSSTIALYRDGSGGALTVVKGTNYNAENVGRISVGDILTTGWAWAGKQGIAGYDASGKELFYLSSDGNDSQIARWTFSYTDSSGGALVSPNNWMGMYTKTDNSTDPFAYLRINYDGDWTTRNNSVMIGVDSATGVTHRGIKGLDASGNVTFALGETTSGTVDNQIAGWSFDDEKLFNTNGSNGIYIGVHGSALETNFNSPEHLLIGHFANDAYGWRINSTTTGSFLKGVVGSNGDISIRATSGSSTNAVMGDYTGTAGADFGFHLAVDGTRWFRVSNGTAEIAGWEFTSNQLIRENIGSTNIDVALGNYAGSGVQGIHIVDKNGASLANRIVMGYEGANTGSIIGYSNGATVFRLSTNPNASRIAGWKFTGTQFTSTNQSGGSNGSFTTAGIILNKDGWISAPNFYLSSSGDASFAGNISADSGDIAGWTLTTDYINKDSIYLISTNLNASTLFSTYGGGNIYIQGAQNRILLQQDTNNFVNIFMNSGSTWGITGRSGSGDVFRLGSTNEIASWNFNTGSIWNYDSGGGLEFNATEQFIKLYNDNGSTDSVRIDTSITAPTLSGRYTTIVDTTEDYSVDTNGDVVGSTGDFSSTGRRNVKITFSFKEVSSTLTSGESVQYSFFLQESDASDFSSGVTTIKQYGGTVSGTVGGSDGPSIINYITTNKRYIRLYVPDLSPLNAIDFNGGTSATMRASFKVEQFEPVIHMNPDGVIIYGSDDTDYVTSLGSSIYVGDTVIIPNIYSLSSQTNVSITAGGELVKGAASSMEIKHNIKNLTFDTEKYKKLRPVNFDYIEGTRDHIGFIAEEIFELYPQFSIWDYNKKGKYVPYNIQYDKITALNTRAIQYVLTEGEKLQKRIEELEKEIKKLKS